METIHQPLESTFKWSPAGPAPAGRMEAEKQLNKTAEALALSRPETLVARRAARRPLPPSPSTVIIIANGGLLPRFAFTLARRDKPLLFTNEKFIDRLIVTKAQGTVPRAALLLHRLVSALEHWNHIRPP